MQFLKHTALDDILRNEVTVMLSPLPGSDDVEAAPFCAVFEIDDRPFIDFIPKLNRKYVAPIPDDAVVSRNEMELSVGRYAVVIPRDSEAGRLLVSIFAAKDQK